MLRKNTGEKLEEEVYDLIHEAINKNEFMISNPNVKIRKNPRYYSKDRGANIEFDVSVEKYLDDLDENKDIKPSIIIVIECKDYSNGIPVDDVEEFHAKLQQIGTDNTKGIIITMHGCFQRSAVAYAESKGIALARIIPPERILFVLYCRIDIEKITESERRERIIEPLIENKYMSDGNNFFSSTGDNGLEELIFSLIGID